jgi:hypothetical protein
VGPRAGMDKCEKSRPIGIRSPNRPGVVISIFSTEMIHIVFTVGIKLKHTVELHYPHADNPDRQLSGSD